MKTFIKLSEKSSYKNIIILALISVIPCTICFLFYTSYINPDSNIFKLSSYYFLLKVFYIFCFNLILNLNNKKNMIITFIIFLFIAFANFYIPYNQFTIKDIIDKNDNSRFLLHIILNKNLFLYILLFIMTILSFNEYKNYKNISEAITFNLNIMIISIIISIIFSFLFIIFFLFILNLLKDFIVNTFYNTSLILNIFVLSIFYIFAFSPFISYMIYRKDIKYNNISIYFSRIIMYISLFNITKYLLSMIIPYNNSYDIRMNFIIYNIALTIGAVNLFLVRIDLKSTIFTKIVYIIFPTIVGLFNIIILSSTVYRIIEYGISPNKITLLIANIIIFIHFIFILIENIKSLKKLDSIRNIKNIILTNNKSYYIYVYGILAFIVCFIIPLFYK